MRCSLRQTSEAHTIETSSIKGKAMLDIKNKNSVPEGLADLLDQLTAEVSQEDTRNIDVDEILELAEQIANYWTDIGGG